MKLGNITSFGLLAKTGFIIFSVFRQLKQELSNNIFVVNQTGVLSADKFIVHFESLLANLYLSPMHETAYTDFSCKLNVKCWQKMSLYLSKRKWVYAFRRETWSEVFSWIFVMRENWMWLFAILLMKSYLNRAQILDSTDFSGRMFLKFFDVWH